MTALHLDVPLASDQEEHIIHTDSIHEECKGENQQVIDLKQPYNCNRRSTNGYNRRKSSNMTYIPAGSVTVRHIDRIEGFCGFWFIILFLSTIALFLVSGLKDDKYYQVLCISLSMYEVSIIILCSYYCWHFPWSVIKNTVTINKFWIQSSLCFLFNIIAFMLMMINLSTTSENINKWYFGYAMTYFFGAFSIPFPAVCIKLHRDNKVDEQNESNQSISSISRQSHNPLGTEQVRTWLSTIQWLQYYDTFINNGIDDMDTVKELTDERLEKIGINKMGDRIKIIKQISQLQHTELSNAINTIPINKSIDSVVASIEASKPIFRDNVLKGLICLCYAVHFVLYTGSPAINGKTYVDIINIMYNNQASTLYIILYKVNQIILRTFMGMSLTSVFFTIVTELTDKKIAKTNFKVLYDIWKDELNWFWIFVSLLFVILLGFEFPDTRSYFRSHIAIDINIDLCVNLFWLVINIISLMILVYFFQEFGGIYHKTQREYQTFFRANSSPTSPINAFVLESLLLLFLYALYILFLWINFPSTIIWDICRQFSIWMVLLAQFVTLIRMKQIQKFGIYYLEHFDKRFAQILHGYFKWMCITLVYNIIYVFIFKTIYFGSNDTNSEHKYEAWA
eukprot:349427_1